MKPPIFSTAGESDALQHARNQLLQWGYAVVPFSNDQATHLLLPVPSFDRSGILKGDQPFSEVLELLPEGITIFGGNLPPLPRSNVDFLQDEYYLGENAAITAHCALKIIQQQVGDLTGARVLVIGWGRIGKRLVSLLSAKGAIVSVAVRKTTDAQALQQLGYTTLIAPQWDPIQYNIIVNTAPTPLLSESATSPSALLLDLASTRGIEGNRVIWARGLPNRDAPDASGLLMAKTALRYALRKE